MRNSREAKADRFFSCTDSERAAFEAGIKMGTIYHQFVGVPLSVQNVGTLEKAIESGSRVQPFVENVRVRIDRTRLKDKRGQYDYVSLTGDMLDVTLVVKYKTARVRASMKLIEEMNYPLMFIEEIEKI
ncbi:MAG: dihydroneopterin aldolase family protein [Thermoplasmatota archaeon]|nr:dihydroneopterin aldolase family protein [Candidatus Thermoplasmatota archaeon]MBU1914656.1 dihydroneopterin aldolase family protein [Candidatus Thermoplasmatota archaeon]